ATTVTTVVEADLDPDTLDGGWVRIDLPGRAALQHVELVDATLYAAGWNNVESQTEVWRSANGREWQRVPDPDEVFFDAVVNDFIAVDGVVVAVGARRAELESSGVVQPTVWRSQDGTTFTRLGDERVATWAATEPAPARAGALEAVTMVDGRLVAVGWHSDGSLLGPGNASLAGVWISDFGDTWEVAFENPAALGGPGTAMTDVATSDEGVVIATGSSDGAATVWESTDARSWVVSSNAAPQVFSGAGNWEATAVAVNPLRTLVLGSSRTESSAPMLRMWASDGVMWEPLAIPELEGVSLDAVAELAPGFLAVGRRRLADDRVIAGLWASPGGSDWSGVDIEDVPFDESGFGEVIVHPSGLVVVGDVFGQPAIWYRARDDVDRGEVAAGAPLPPPAWATIFQEQTPSQSAPIMLQLTNSTIFGVSDARTIWTSTDGRSWAPMRFADAGLASVDRITSVIENDGRFLAIAEDDEVGLWLSDDGAMWRPPIETPPCCIGAVFPSNDGGFRALGQDPADDAWFLSTSDDGSAWSVNAELPNLEVERVSAATHLGNVDLIWTVDGDSTGAWTSADGITWLPVEDLGVTAWTGMWRARNTALAAARTDEGLALFRTNGVSWDRVDLTGIDLQSATIRGAAAVGDGISILTSQPGQPQRIYQLVEGGVPREILLSGTMGFGGLSAVLVSDSDQLRVVGPDHGRMTVWEWVPSE
ncbi:MAG: hypothetical protein OEM97_04915, partial [Acidimicrobiia bacterium]|nr:hypothetical protein [Acidimicrobiia bacterium]